MKKWKVCQCPRWVKLKIVKCRVCLSHCVVEHATPATKIKEGFCEGSEQGSYDFSNNLYINNLIAGLNTEQNQIIFLHEVLSASSTPDNH